MILYQVIRRDANGTQVWERFSRKKQSYFATVGSMNSFYGAKPGESVTIYKLNIGLDDITQMEMFTK